MNGHLRLLVTAAAVALAVAVGIVLVLTTRSGPTGSDVTAPTPTPTATPPTEDATGGPEERPTETLAEQIARVARIVQDVRELSFSEDPEPLIVSPDELADRVTEQVSAYTVEDADLDGRLLALLGAVEPGTDLRELLVTAYGEQVAGYYDSEDGELVVGAPDEGGRLSRVNEVVLAHELQHALADQALGLPELEDLEDGREDEVLARQALIEGDATVTMQRYAEVGLSVVDQLLMAQEVTELQAGLQDLTQLPPYLQGSIEFPYTEGAVFVAALLEQGGWAAVDAAYATPPVSTAQILYPERYLAGTAPRPAPGTGPAGDGWEMARTYGFGAADLLLLFQAPGGDPSRSLPDPRGAAAGWEGGEVRLWTAGERSAAAVALAGTGLCEPLDRWYATSFPDSTRSQAEGAVVFQQDGQAAVLRCSQTGTRLGIGPELATATRLVAP